MWVLAALGMAAVGAWMLASGGSSPIDPEDTDPAGAAQVRDLVARAGLGRDWQDFLVVWAHTESRWNPRVGLGIPSAFPPGTQPNRKASEKLQRGEARAAQRVYQRNVDQFRACSWPPSWYTFGSGGWFGFLPTVGLAAFFGTRYACVSPAAVFDPATSVVMALAMCQRLQRWDSYKAAPSFARLREGIARGQGAMAGEPDWERRAAQARAAGVDPDVMRRRPSNLRISPAELLDRLGGATV